MIALAVHPVLAVLAVVVAAPAGSDEGCPSAHQVTDAMSARFPAFVIAPDQTQSSARPDVLRALLDVAADGTVVRFSLVDARGETQLRRTLPAPGRGRPVSDCLALADTLAAIVERYLGTISYDASDPASPAADAATPNAANLPVATAAPIPVLSAAPKAPPRGAFVLLGLGWRMPSGGQPSNGEIEGRIGAEVDLTVSNPRLAAMMSLGAASAIRIANLDEQRTATIRRFPARLGALLKVPAGPGWVEPSLALGLDLLTMSSTAGFSHPASQTYRWGPGVEAAVGYRLKVAGVLHLRPRAAFGFAIQRYDVAVQEAPNGVVFGTPRAYASFGIDTGVLFQ